MIRKKNERCRFGWVGSQGEVEVKGGKPYSEYVAWKNSFLIKKQIKT